MNFSIWLEQQSNIFVNYDPIKQSFLTAKKDFIDSLIASQAKVGNFNPQQFFEKIKKILEGYPQAQNFLKALESKNPNYIFSQQKAFFEWGKKNIQVYAAMRSMNSDIWTYIDWLNKEDFDLNKNIHQLDELISKNLVKVEFFANKIHHNVQQAISRIVWNGSKIIIQPSPPQEYNSPIIDETSWAYIQVGDDPHVFFTIGYDNDKLDIDEVLEGDDTDIFSVESTKIDYFMLINELRNPGSTSKGRSLILYTARPKNDRSVYLNSNKLPINIFLTSSFDDAEGISMDFEKRDIWKVKVNSRYLTKTLDTKRVQHYQVTSPEAVADFVELIG